MASVGEGSVHRLWGPLNMKHHPPRPYAAKFSTPFCVAVGFFDRRAGFAQFTAREFLFASATLSSKNERSSP
jgi:hypothetical protein